MKQFCFILLLALLATINMQAQALADLLPYKPLSDFKNDTTAYVIYNFIDRADCYKGKIFELFLEDLDFNIESLLFYWEPDRYRRHNAIEFSNYSEKEADSLILAGEKVYLITVIWENPISLLEVSKAFRNSRRWDQKKYLLYRDMVIKKIIVTPKRISPRKKDYRNKISY